MSAVVRLSELPTYRMEPEGGHPTLGAEHAKVGLALGAAKLGATYTSVEPGKRAYPRHAHHANEEMFVILEGAGVYHIGDETHPVEPGDVCFAPTGGAETAHGLENTGDAPLRYLAISTLIEPEIVEYPDSSKFAAMTKGPGRTFANVLFKHVGRQADGVDYWDGET